ncbi:hypothetical protein H2248_009773 [Termitomyces sp. 'cryptogamus']|nr:hypothetical protein H2248_009773 [Termitomyces sp. 'cryptogamus']
MLRYTRNFFLTAAQTTNSSTTVNDNQVDNQLFKPSIPYLFPRGKTPRTSETTPNDLANLLERDKNWAILPADHIAQLTRCTRSQRLCTSRTTTLFSGPNNPCFIMTRLIQEHRFSIVSSTLQLIVPK